MGSCSSRMSSSPPAVTCSGSARSRMSKFPAAFVTIAKQIEDAQWVLEDLQQLPDFIVKNSIWSLLCRRVKLVRVVCWFTSLAVLRVLLDDNTQLVIKGCPPECLERERQQLAAEIAVATSFPLHPLMATVIASSEEPSGMCSVLPYAGVSFEAIMQHEDFYTKLTEQERSQVFRELAAHTLTVHARLQEQGSGGFVYRDTKPENITFDPATGQVKLIDFGFAMHLNGCDYRDGFTVGRFTPEMVDPAGGFSSFWTSCGRLLALNSTTDVFLTGQQGLEMIQGLPQQLQPCPYDMADRQAMDAILLAHHHANYPKLIRRLHSSKAKDFLLRAMTVDPHGRLTPAGALQHTFLAATAAAVRTRLAETLPAHVQQVHCILDLLAPLQGQRGVFLAAQQQRRCKLQQNSAVASGLAVAIAAAIKQRGGNTTTEACSCSSMILDVPSESSSSTSPATAVSPKVQQKTAVAPELAAAIAAAIQQHVDNTTETCSCSSMVLDVASESSSSSRSSSTSPVTAVSPKVQQKTTVAPDLAAVIAAAIKLRDGNNTTETCSCSSITPDVASESSSSSDSSSDSSSASPITAVSPKDSISASRSGCSDVSSTASDPSAADSVITRDTVHRKQLGLISTFLRKLKIKISTSNDTSESRNSNSSSRPSICTAVSRDVAVIGAMYGDPADAVVIIEPATVSVPGWCGIRWCARNSCSRLSGKEY